MSDRIRFMIKKNKPLTDRQVIEAILDSWDRPFTSNLHSLIIGKMRYHFTADGEINRITDYAARKTYTEREEGKAKK